MASYVLPEGLPAPVVRSDGSDAAYWEGTRRHELFAQRCNACGNFQWPLEVLCFECHSFDVGFAKVGARGTIYSWERVWHPVHKALTDGVPYTVLLVDLDDAPGVRMVGNLAGDPLEPFAIGDAVEAVFEDHDDAETPYTLVQWRTIKA